MPCCRAVDAPLPPLTAPPGSSAGPDAPAGPAPGRKSAVAFYLLVMLLVLPGSLAQRASSWAGLLWTELFAFLLPAAIVAAGSNLRPARYLRIRPVPRRLLVLGGVAGAAGTLLAAAIQVTLQRLLPAGWFDTFDLSHLFMGPDWERYALAALAVSVAPFCEEATFRGFLLTTLGARLRPAAAVLTTAVLFAAAHLDPVRFLGLVGLGALWGWLTLRAGSIWPAVAAHAANNAVAAWGLLSSGPVEGAEAMPPFAVVALLTSGLGTAVLVPVLVAYRRATNPPPAEDPLEPMDGADADPRRRFRWRRVPGAFRWAMAAGALSLAAIALLGD